MAAFTHKPQCWAYHPDSARCQGDAGHDGNHHYVVRWDDGEVWVPVLHLGTDSVPATPSGPSTPTVVAEVATRCDPEAGCGHAWHDDTCTVLIGPGVPCGCMTAI